MSFRAGTAAGSLYVTCGRNYGNAICTHERNLCGWGRGHRRQQRLAALVPQGLNPNAKYQLPVQRGATRSVPIPVTVVELQPGIYTEDFSGSGQGIVAIAGTSALAAPSDSGGRPARRGVEYLTIYCTGLGPVHGPNGEPGPRDGAAAPLSPLFSTIGTVHVTIGGVDAPVTFAGLTPTLAGLYQVNVQLPVSAPAGDAIPLVMTVSSPVSGTTARSNSVTIALQ